MTLNFGIEAARIPLAIALVFASVFALQFSLWVKRAGKRRAMFHAIVLTGAVGTVLLEGIYSIAAMELAMYAAGFLLYFDSSHKSPVLHYFAANVLGSVLILAGSIWAVPLLLAGFLIKLGAFPLHFWVRPVLENSYAETAGIVSASLSSAVLFAMAANSVLSSAFIPIGLAGALAGAIFALGAASFRQKAAYISVAATGIALSALGFGTPLIGIALALVFSQLFAKQLLFIVSGIVEEEATANFGLNSTALLAASFSLAGIPLTAGFVPLHELFFHAVSLQLYSFSAVLLAALLLLLYSCLSLYRQLAERVGNRQPSPQLNSMLSMASIALVAAGIAFWVMV